MKKLFLSLFIALTLSAGASAKTLVAYFSYPVFDGKNELDATSGASVTVGTKQGNNEYVARIIARTLGADLFKIDTGNHYPTDYNKLFDVTQSEQRKNIRPKLVQHIQNMADYDTVILCYPIWWYKLPLPVHSFLDEYDLSGKTIYISVVHGGSRISGTDREIAQAEPKATVSKNTLAISRNQVAKSDRQIEDWAKSLGK